MSKGERGNIPVFVPMLGCPHQCVFCNQHAITGKKSEVYLQDIEMQIQEAVRIYGPGKHKELAFFGGSFTCLPLEMQKRILNMASPLIAQELVKGIRISTRPDYIYTEVLNLLKECGVTTIELGIQSTDSIVLAASGRGHTRDDIMAAASRIRKQFFNLGLQMMVGLPEDSLQKSIRTALDIIECHADFVRIYPTLVLRDSPLEKSYLRGEYKPLSLQEALHHVRDLKILFEYHDIPVIRTGLQSNEGLDQARDFIAGPYHPAFGELADNEVYLLEMEKMIKQALAHRAIKKRGQSPLEDEGGKFSRLTIKVSPAELSRAIGQKRRNILELENRYPGLDIQIKGDEALTSQEIQIVYQGICEKIKKMHLLEDLAAGILKNISN